MNKIGQGYYYDVYDLGNGRVLKTGTNHGTRLKKLFDWYGKTRRSQMRIFFTYPRYAWDARRELKRSVETSTLDPEIFGNPVFKNGFDYEQDSNSASWKIFRESYAGRKQVAI